MGEIPRYIRNFHSPIETKRQEFQQTVSQRKHISGQWAYEKNHQ